MNDNKIKSLNAQIDAIENKMKDAKTADEFTAWKTEREKMTAELKELEANKPSIKPTKTSPSDVLDTKILNSFELSSVNPDPNVDCCKIYNAAVDMTSGTADVDAKLFSRPSVDWIDNDITLMPLVQTFSSNVLDINLRQEDTAARQDHVDTVAEAGALPSSSYGVKESTERMKYLGGMYRTTQQLDLDAQKDYFRTYIRARFDYDIRKEIEQQAFFGQGKNTTAHPHDLKGFFTKASGAKLDESSDLGVTKASGDTNSDVVQKVLDKMPNAAANMASTSEAGVNPDVITMNRKTWARFQIAKDNDGRYLLDRFIPAPAAEGTMNLWGMRLVLSERIADNDYFMFASSMLEFHTFNGGAIKYDVGQTGTDFQTLQNHVRGYLWAFSHEFRPNAVKRGIVDA